MRFRPIMMTTMAALVGHDADCAGYGAGANSRRPLGLAVVGGLIVSQMLTLYITPVFYVYIEGGTSMAGQAADLSRGPAIPSRRLRPRSPCRTPGSGHSGL